VKSGSLVSQELLANFLNHHALVEHRYSIELQGREQLGVARNLNFIRATPELKLAERGLRVLLRLEHLTYLIRTLQMRMPCCRCVSDLVVERWFPFLPCFGEIRGVTRERLWANLLLACLVFLPRRTLRIFVSGHTPVNWADTGMAPPLCQGSSNR